MIYNNHYNYLFLHKMQNKVVRNLGINNIKKDKTYIYKTKFKNLSILLIMIKL